MKIKNIFKVGIFLIIWLALVAFYQTNKKLPEGLNYESSSFEVEVDEIDFLYDLTYENDAGERVKDQEIFPEIFRSIEEAEKYILIDMFLFNDYQGESEEASKELSGELTQKLVDQKKKYPDLKIDFISDPINTVYGGGNSFELEQLEEGGVNVIVTDLDKLRDSNFLYSSFWRSFIGWSGNSEENGWIRHPFDSSQEKVTIRSYLKLLNFKANHRKVFVADSGGQMVSVVTSANPHDGSSEHSNVGLKVIGDFWKAVYESEKAVAEMSGGSLSEVDFESEKKEGEDRGKIAKVKLITEEKIKREILDEINKTKKGDEIRIAQFYFSEREILEALLSSADREVDIKIILDPNKDAFGYEKSGIPNRQVAEELIGESGDKIKIRWYNTDGEQFHSKLFYSKKDEQIAVILGSANLTRRNLNNYNLEMGVKIEAVFSSELNQEVREYFDLIWENESAEYTLDYEKYHDNSFLRGIVYRVQEATGLSSF